MRCQGAQACPIIFQFSDHVAHFTRVAVLGVVGSIRQFKAAINSTNDQVCLHQSKGQGVHHLALISSLSQELTDFNFACVHSSLSTVNAQHTVQFALRVRAFFAHTPGPVLSSSLLPLFSDEHH